MGGTQIVDEAARLESQGRVHEAVDLLTSANRDERDPRLEVALVRLRREGCRQLAAPTPPTAMSPIAVEEATGDDVCEVDAGDLTLAALRHGLARSGCLLVRGLVGGERTARLVEGIDAAFAGHDAAEAEGGPGVEGSTDPGAYRPFRMPFRLDPADLSSVVVSPPPEKIPPAVPLRRHRGIIRSTGGLWTVDSPRMLFELFELVDDVGIGAVATGLLGERPYLSANKCTLRRVPPDAGLGGWHQDGAFLGQEVGAFNFWLALSDCGVDAPGLDLLPRRVDRVLDAGEGAPFPWTLSDDCVRRAANGAPIVRPVFRAGDALLFDHLLVHRTAATAAMAHERHSIEAWFFAPSAWPVEQLPLFY